MIVDTGPLVAALNRRESNHELAVSVLEEAGAGARILDRQHVDLQLGLTDCVVMTLASRLGEPVFTFDFRDFRAVTIGGRTLDLVVSEADAGR